MNKLSNAFSSFEVLISVVLISFAMALVLNFGQHNIEVKDNLNFISPNQSAIMLELESKQNPMPFTLMGDDGKSCDGFIYVAKNGSAVYRSFEVKKCEKN